MDTGQPPNGLANPYAPPQAAIDVAAPRPLETGGFKSATGLANAIAIVLSVEALADVGLIAQSFVTIGVMQRVVAGEPAEQGVLTAMSVRTGALGTLSGLLTLAAVVLFCLFMPRANRNARWFRAPLSNSPGWAAGWFFVPVAGWWKPYYAMKEIWRGSDPDPAVNPLEAPGSALVGWWWAMFVLRTIGGMVTYQLQVKTPSDLIDAAWIQIICLAPSIAAAILAGAVVRALARRQDERQRRELAGASPAATAGAAP